MQNVFAEQLKLNVDNRIQGSLTITPLNVNTDEDYVLNIHQIIILAIYIVFLLLFLPFVYTQN